VRARARSAWPCSAPKRPTTSARVCSSGHVRTSACDVGSGARRARSAAAPGALASGLSPG
jgi:hypothetical protein